MQGLPGVLLHVGALDRHRVLRAFDVQSDLALIGNGLVVLADLVVLRHVRVEIVLAGEPAPACDGTAQRQADPDGRLNCLAIDHRQRTGQTQAHRAGMGIRFGAELRGAAAPHLRFGVELDMHLEAQHHVEARHDLVVVHQPVIAVLHAHFASFPMLTSEPGSAAARSDNAASYPGPTRRSRAAPTR